MTFENRRGSVDNIAVQQVCTANVNPTTTTPLTVTGMSIGITSSDTTAKWAVEIDADVTIVIAGTLNTVELLVDGVAQGSGIRTFSSGTGAWAGHKKWIITGLSAGAHTFTARSFNSAGGTSAIVNASVSLMTVTRLS